MSDVFWEGEFRDDPHAILSLSAETQYFFNAYVIQMMDYLRAFQLGMYVLIVVIVYHVEPVVFSVRVGKGGFDAKMLASIALDILQFYPILDMLLRLRFLWKPTQDFQYRIGHRLHRLRHHPNPAPFAPYEAHSHAIQHALLATFSVLSTVIMRVYNNAGQTQAEAATAKLTPAIMLMGNSLIHSAQFG